MRSGLSSSLRSPPQAVELDNAELRQRQISLGVLHRKIGLGLALGVGGLERRHRGRHAGEGMALEEAVLRPAGRAAHQRHRPAENVRQHEVADEGVVDRDVELGRPGFAKDAPRRVGHPHRRQIGLGDEALAFGRHRRRQLDVAQSLEHGVPQRIVGGAVGVVDMRRQHRPHPDHLLRRAVERGCAGFQRLQPGEQRSPAVSASKPVPTLPRYCSSPSSHSPSPSAASPSAASETV